MRGLVGLMLVLFASSSAAEERPAGKGEGAVMDLARLVPDAHEGWRAEGSDGRYDRETIFDYMNGAGEIYLAFDFRRLFVRQFAREGEPGIVVEIYDMGRSDDAYGIFMRNRMGDEAGIGQGSEYASGHLFFWKDPIFGIVYATRETDAARAAVLGIGAEIAARIPTEGALPDLVGLLPEADLDPRSVRFFHSHFDLNQHYFLADENILGLGRDTDAVVAGYGETAVPALLLVVRYPSEEGAAAARERLLAEFLPEGRATGAAVLEDGTWVAVDRHGAFLAAVLDGADEESARALLKTAVARLRGEEER